MMLHLMSLDFFVSFSIVRKKVLFWFLRNILSKMTNGDRQDERRKESEMNSIICCKISCSTVENGDYFLPVFLGNLSHQYHLFLLMLASFPSFSSSRSSVHFCGVQTFVDFFVNNNSCHWLPWLLLPWFLSDKSHSSPRSGFVSPFLFLSHLPLSWSDWGIIAKLNTFRAIAHVFSFPPCDVRTFQRAFPQGLLTSCLSCLWLAQLVSI